MAITLGLVEAVDNNGVYVSMPGSRGVLRGPYSALQHVAAGERVLVISTDDGEQVVAGAVGEGQGVSVKALGAKGDGVTDDTAALQAAVDVVAGLGGGRVYLPSGVYRVTDTVTLTDGITFEGAGMSDDTGRPTRLDCSDIDGTSPAIAFANCGDVTLRDFYLTGRTSGSADEIKATGVVRGMTLERVIVNSSTTGAGVSLSVAGAPGDCVITSTVNQVTVVGAKYGFRLGEGCTSVTFSDCWARLCTEAGYQILGTYSSLVSCAADLCTFGYVVQDAVSVSLVGCGAEQSLYSGWVFVGASQVVLSGCRGVANNTDGDPGMPSFGSVNAGSTNVVLIGCTDTAPTSGTAVSLGCFSGAAGLVTTLGCSWALPVSAYAGIPDVTGSRGGNAALASLLTALEDLGLITDSSS